jgi:hypothetical protein
MISCARPVMSDVMPRRGVLLGSVKMGSSRYSWGTRERIFHIVRSIIRAVL